MGGRRTNGTGSVYQDKRGVWIGEAVLDGKRRRVTATTKTDASAKLMRLIVGAETGTAVLDGGATVADLIEQWRTRTLANRELTSKSRDNYEMAMRVLRDELGSVRLRVLKVDQVEKALDRIASGVTGRGKPISRRTLKLYRSTLAQVVDSGIRRGVLAMNVARVAELTPTAAKTNPRRALNSDEAGLLWTACEDQRLGNLFRLMLTTGMRPGETLGLCWDKVDLERGMLHVHRSVQLQGGSSVLVDTVKTASSYRTIGLPTPAIDVLRAQRKIAAKAKLAAKVWVKDDPGLVFPTRHGTPWDLSNVRDELTRISVDAGIGRVRPHELRHSAASILNDQGVPLELIADLLGHVDTTMLSRTYRHRLRPSADAAVEVMGQMFGGARNA